MSAHKSGDPTTINRLYGRAKGKPLRAGQQGLIDDRNAALCLICPDAGARFAVNFHGAILIDPGPRSAIDIGCDWSTPAGCAIISISCLGVTS